MAPPPLIPKTKVRLHKNSPLRQKSPDPTHSLTRRTQAQHLERVRQNQQRSRQRKRAYVARLEQELAQLGGREPPLDASASAPTDDIVASPGRLCPIQAHTRLQSENDARRVLLLSMGVSVAAQEAFIRTAVTGAEAGESASPGGEQSGGCPAHLADYGPPLTSQPARPARMPPDPPSISRPIGLHPSRCPVARFPVPYVSNASKSTWAEGGGGGEDGATAGSWDLLTPKFALQQQQQPQAASNATDATVNTFAWPLEETAPSILSFQPSQTMRRPFLPPSALLNASDDDPPGEQPRLADSKSDFLGPSRSAAVQSNSFSHAPDDASDGTTACNIAASLVMTNNAIGCSAEELESRLRVGYLVAGVGEEDCRILNRVLFTVLAEISWPRQGT